MMNAVNQLLPEYKLEYDDLAAWGTIILCNQLAVNGSCYAYQNEEGNALTQLFPDNAATL